MAKSCRACAEERQCKEVGKAVKKLKNHPTPPEAEGTVKRLRENGHSVPKAVHVSLIKAYLNTRRPSRNTASAAAALRTMHDEVCADSASVDMVLAKMIECKQLHEALDVLRWAIENDMSPNERTECMLVYEFGRVGDMESALQGIALREEYGRKVLGQLYHSLVRGLADNGFPSKAEEVVEMLGADRYSLERQSLASRSGAKLKPLAANYDPILAAYAAFGMISEAQQTLGRMKWRGVKPNVRAFNHVIKAASRAGNCSAALSVLRELEGGGSYDVEALGLSPDVVSYSTAMDCLAQKGNVDGVRELMQRMVDKSNLQLDQACWGTLVKTYSYAGDPVGAENVLQEMRDAGGLTPSELSYTSVVAAYCFQGEIDEAWRIIDNMKLEKREPNHVTYGHIIWACGKYGVAPRAAHALSDMVKQGVNPSQGNVRELLQNAYGRNNLPVEQADELVDKAVNVFRNFGTYAASRADDTPTAAGKVAASPSPSASADTGDAHETTHPEVGERTATTAQAVVQHRVCLQDPGRRNRMCRLRSLRSRQLLRHATPLIG